MTRKSKKQIIYYDSDSTDDEEYAEYPEDLVRQEKWDIWWERIRDWGKIDPKIEWLGATEIAGILEEPCIPLKDLPKNVDLFMFNNILNFIPWWFSPEDPHCIKARSLIVRLEKASENYVFRKPHPMDRVSAPLPPKRGCCF